MKLQDQDTLAALVDLVESRNIGGGVDGWIEQVDDEGDVRVLVGHVAEVDFEGAALSVFQVKLAGHWTSPIYYVFERRATGSGHGYAKVAHYILSHQEPRRNRLWFCATVQRCVPHVAVYRGDLGLVGARFKPVEMV